MINRDFFCDYFANLLSNVFHYVEIETLVQLSEGVTSAL